MSEGTYQSGRMAEIRAGIHLLLRGFLPVAWRYKTPVGEIDLVARRGRTLVFAEVKYRPDLIAGSFALQPRQMGRLRRAAGYFMHDRNIGSDTVCRFDLIAVDAAGRIRHLDNILIETT